MRIGIDARFFGPIETGIGRYVERLVTHLAAIDERNEYVLFLRRRAFDWWQPPNARWRKVLADINWYGLSEQRLMPGIFRRANCDLLHIPHFNVPLLTRRPFMVTIHDLILDEFPTERATSLEPLLFAIKFRAYQAVVRHAVRDSRAIITVSEHSKQRLLERFNVASEKISVTYESVDSLPVPEPFETLADKGVTRPYLLHVGNTYPHKNLDRLISAAEKLWRKNIDFQLVLVGKDDYFSRRLRAAVTKRQLSQVHFYNFASDQELAALYKYAVAYFFPSLSEGFGLPGLEAMQAGIPVYAARASCLPEVFGPAASYFDPMSIDAMTQSIEQALYDTVLRQKLVIAGKQRLLDYSWRKMAEETLAVYHQVHQHDNPTTPT